MMKEAILLLGGRLESLWQFTNPPTGEAEKRPRGRAGFGRQCAFVHFQMK